jgi:hypothetical protein
MLLFVVILLLRVRNLEEMDFIQWKLWNEDLIICFFENRIAYHFQYVPVLIVFVLSLKAVERGAKRDGNSVDTIY